MKSRLLATVCLLCLAGPTFAQVTLPTVQSVKPTDLIPVLPGGNVSPQQWYAKASTLISPSGPLTATPPQLINPIDSQWAGGLICNGNAANATQNTAALNAAVASSNIEVDLPSGTCVINGPIVIAGQHVLIHGQGQSTVIQQTSGGSALVFAAVNASTGGRSTGNRIENFYLNNSNASAAIQSGVGIDMIQQPQFSCSNVAVHDFFIGIFNEGSADVKCQGLDYEGGNFWPLGVPYAVGGVYSAGLKLAVYAPYTTGQYNPSMECVLCHLTGNVAGLNQTLAYSVEVNDADGIRFTDDYFGWGAISDMYFQTPSGSGVNNSVITGSMFDNAGSNVIFDAASPGASVTVAINFVGNNFRSAGHGSLTVVDSVTIKSPLTSVGFKQNYFYTHGGWCIDVTDSATVVLDGNDLSACGSAPGATGIGAININPTSASTSAAYEIGRNRIYNNTDSGSAALVINGANIKYLSMGCNPEWGNTADYSYSNISVSTTTQQTALCNNSSGSIIASLPDSGINGGNPRGHNAVDLQSFRNSADQVAGASYSTITGGADNRIATGASFATVGGGKSNVAAGNYSTVFGETNLAQGDVSFMSGYGANDFKNMGINGYSAGYNNTSGDSAIWNTTLHGVTSGSASVVLTADGQAPRDSSGGAGNCITLPGPNFTYDLNITVSFVDTTNQPNIFHWKEDGVYYMNGTAPTWVPATGGPTIQTIAGSQGWSGGSITVARNQTPNCLFLTAHPPTSDAYDITAMITGVTNQ